jgi:putative glutathione S-transferase
LELSANNSNPSKCGLAKTQEAYHKAVSNLFNSLDRIEAHLSSQNGGPYYLGEQITEADVRLYVTIVRFDTVYVSLFKTNRAMIRHQYPHIDKWARNLYWNVPAFKDTTSFEHIKGHYFKSLTPLNPEGIIPEGPLPHILPLN